MPSARVKGARVMNKNSGRKDRPGSPNREKGNVAANIFTRGKAWKQVGQSFSSSSDRGSRSNGFFVLARDLLSHFLQIREITASGTKTDARALFSFSARTSALFSPIPDAASREIAMKRCERRERCNRCECREHRERFGGGNGLKIEGGAKSRDFRVWLTTRPFISL